MVFPLSNALGLVSVSGVVRKWRAKDAGSLTRLWRPITPGRKRIWECGWRRWTRGEWRYPSVGFVDVYQKVGGSGAVYRM